MAPPPTKKKVGLNLLYHSIFVSKSYVPNFIPLVPFFLVELELVLGYGGEWWLGGSVGAELQKDIFCPVS